VVSNHRPPPCEGEAKLQARGLSGSGRVPLSSLESLWVPLSCYAGVKVPERSARRVWDDLEAMTDEQPSGRASGIPPAEASRDDRSDGAHAHLPADIFSSTVQLGAPGRDRGVNEEPSASPLPSSLLPSGGGRRCGLQSGRPGVSLGAGCRRGSRPAASEASTREVSEKRGP
jgi:hypothetical protein